jgi:rhodanese-related sulfurtransferase
MTTTVDLDGLDELVRNGAVVIDVLPASTYTDVHVPGARNIPLTELDESATSDLDRSTPVVVYCFDYQCDLSPRAAARLESLGFEHVADFAAGRAAWSADGRPTEGEIGDRDRIIDRVRRDVPRSDPDASVADVRKSIGDWELCAVVDSDGILLGVIRADALEGSEHLAARDLLVPGPGTVRPDARVTEMAEQLDRDRLEHVLVTTFGGRLIGLLRRSDLDADR